MKRLLGVCLILLLPALAQAQPVFSYRCTLDSLAPAEAEARLAWARRCGLIQNVGSPAAWFDTYAPSSNGSGTLKDYAEADLNSNPYGQNSYSGHGFALEVNNARTLALYNSGPTAQAVDGSGYYQWDRTLDRKKPRPLYPTFGSMSDIYSPSSVPLYPNPNNPNDCGLYRAEDLGALQLGMMMPIYEEPCSAIQGVGVQCGGGGGGVGPFPAASFFVNAYCESSCYAPEQRVLFPDGAMAIRDAVAAAKPQVMTLASSSTLHSFTLQALPTYSYTSELRDATHPLVVVQTASGGELRVTTEHPVINSEGRIVQAQALKVGDELVRVDGKFDPIVAVTREAYFGKVYNLRPDASDRLAHVLVAEGYLVGSSLFQNDEVGYINRLILFKSVPDSFIP